MAENISWMYFVSWDYDTDSFLKLRTGCKDLCGLFFVIFLEQIFCTKL